ncbi:MAG: hypothetical protein HQM00_14295, partial [Magnetococcales bacterium]|nr:hypothetical protein [Magnetococcales bacterium]
MTLRPWPNALSGRIVLILLTGVFLALASGAMLHLHERSRAISSFGGVRTAQEFVGIVHLLDSLPPAERGKVAVLWETPLHYLRFLPSRTPPQKPDEKNQDPRAERLEQVLRTHLGHQRPLHVVVLNNPDPPALPPTGPELRREGNAPPYGPRHGMMVPPPNRPMHHWRYRGMMEPLMPLGVSYLVRTQLRGGDWVEFHSHLSGEVFEWPE